MLLILLGVVLSLLWCWAGWYYLEMAIGFDNLMLFLPHEIGQFAVGFFTPLFLLWILITLMHLVRRIGRLSESPPESGGSRTLREPLLEPREKAAPAAKASMAPRPAKVQETAPKPVTPEAESRKPSPVKPRESSAKVETTSAEKIPAPPAVTPAEKPAGTPSEMTRQGASRARASAMVRTTDAAGNSILRKVEHSAVSGSGPAQASATAVGRDASQTPASFEARGSKQGVPPKRPTDMPQPSMPEPEPEAKLPPKRPSDAKTPEQQREAEEMPPGSPAGPLPPKRPPEENVAPLPRSAGGTLPPKNPRNIVESYASVQDHTVNELNAIAMDTAILICDPGAYHDSREALNDGQDDSFFRLLTDKLESDGQEALVKLRLGGNIVLLESYCSKFKSLLQAAEQEPDGKDLRAHLQKSAPGRLYATIESKL